MEPITYMSIADIAALFGVQPNTAEKWRQRYADFPAPDATTGMGHGRPVMGWLPEREEEIREWKKQTVRDGPGRPPKVAAAKG